MPDDRIPADSSEPTDTATTRESEDGDPDDETETRPSPTAVRPTRRTARDRSPEPLLILVTGALGVVFGVISWSRGGADRSMPRRQKVLFRTLEKASANRTQVHGLPPHRTIVLGAETVL